MSAATCEPPEAHRHHEWHWLRLPGMNRWYCAQAKNGRLWTGPGNKSAREAWLQGWRYVGPALPPEDPETGGGR